MRNETNARTYKIVVRPILPYEYTAGTRANTTKTEKNLRGFRNDALRIIVKKIRSKDVRTELNAEKNGNWVKKFKNN